MFPKAEEAINKALALNPDLAEAHAALGGLIRQMGGEMDKAMFHLERAVELNPSYSPAYNWLGLAYNEMAQFDKAIDVFSRGQQIDPLSAVLASNLAYAAGSVGDYDEMKRRLDRLAETHPESPFAYTGQSYYELLVTGRLDEALRLMLRTVVADPNDTQPRAFVAFFLDSLGDRDAAENWLDSAFALQPNSSDAKAMRVLIDAQNGRLERAQAEAREFAADYGRTALSFEWVAELLNSADVDSGNAQAAIARYRESFPQYWADNARPINITVVDQGIEMVRLLRETGDAERADVLLGEVISVLEAAPIIGLGSGFRLPAAYALAGRTDDAMNALRTVVDAGYRYAWRNAFDHHWGFESLRDQPEFQSMRIELDADMQKQLENARRMQANGEMPTVPGMELLSRPENSGAPPI